MFFFSYFSFRKCSFKHRMKKFPTQNQSVKLISNSQSSPDGKNISITYNKLIGSNKISNGGNSSSNIIITSSDSNNNFGNISPSITNLSIFSNSKFQAFLSLAHTKKAIHLIYLFFSIFSPEKKK